MIGGKIERFFSLMILHTTRASQSQFFPSPGPISRIFDLPLRWLLAVKLPLLAQHVERGVHVEPHDLALFLYPEGEGRLRAADEIPETALITG